jgi:hydroxyacid-oxoacid transhydrogenase
VGDGSRSGTFAADPESVFTYGAPQLKFGVGAADEIGFDLSQYGVQRVLVVTDAGVAATGTPQRIADQMGQFGTPPYSAPVALHLKC